MYFSSADEDPFFKNRKDTQMLKRKTTNLNNNNLSTVAASIFNRSIVPSNIRPPFRPTIVYYPSPVPPHFVPSHYRSVRLSLVG